MQIEFFKLHPDAIIPTKKPGDAGYDLYALNEYTLEPGERQLIRTGISCNLAGLAHFFGPNFCPVGLIRDRSSVATKIGLQTLAGTIDRDYTGEIFVLIRNVSSQESIELEFINGEPIISYSKNAEQDIVIKAGQKVAQMVVTFALNIELIESKTPFNNELRGIAGFGSTGA